MKRIFLTVIIVLCTLISQAQVSSDKSEHLIFKGIPIDGTLNEFVQKMEKNGFTRIGAEDGMVLLKGDFASSKNCLIGVTTLKQKDLVSKVSAVFPESSTWSSLYSNYLSLKEMLIEKYGKPTDNLEEFQTTSQPTDDNSKMYEVKFDRCKYYSSFQTEKGTIELSIDHTGVISCFVTLTYYDKINGVNIRAKAIDDL